MDNLDDSENNAKISDSAYSNSCSNSQSRRSHSSKSTHSGSHSSGSSGYGGKPSTSGYSSNNLSQPQEKRSKDKDNKKKKQVQEIQVQEVQNEVECMPPEPLPVFEAPTEKTHNDNQSPSPIAMQIEQRPETMDTTPDKSSCMAETASCNVPVTTATNYVTSRSSPPPSNDGFACVISMHDGVVMYTTSSLTSSLGFPTDMWLGRSFIDFVHPRDRDTLASQITNGLAVPKNVNGTQDKVSGTTNSPTSIVCRIRKYRGLTLGFGVKDRVLTFMPFLLKLSFKNVSDEDGDVTYLVIQATPFSSAFKSPNEVILKAVPFVIRHAANGILEYIDPESVPYLGYLPQDIADKDVLQLYHPQDLTYLRQVYETIVKEGSFQRSKPYRMLAQNGDYIKLETEWSSFINPWSRKLEFVIGKHHILEGPNNPDVFQSPEPNKNGKILEDEKLRTQCIRDDMIRIMTEVLTKPAELAKQQMTKRCQDLASFMENLMEDAPKAEDELRLEIHDPDHSYYERDSVMLGGISPHHEYSDSKSSTETPISYNQLNYNETLQRYFDSHKHSFSDDRRMMLEGTFVVNKCKEVKPSETLFETPDVSNPAVSAETPVASDYNRVAFFAPHDYQPMRLTESLLNKHNAEMEKELVKLHRENRTSSKGEREKASNEQRQKKKEHLARCNVSFQPTVIGVPLAESQPHGTKRSSKPMDRDGGAKHHCSALRQSRRKQITSAAATPSSTLTNNIAPSPWNNNQVNNMNTFFFGVGVPHHMSLVNPVAAVPGMFPVYYAPTAYNPTNGPPVTGTNTNATTINTSPLNAPPMQCMMYGQAVYASPFVYSPMNMQMSYPMQQNFMTQNMEHSNMPPTMNPLGLASSNYEEACKPSLPMKLTKSYGGAAWREKKRCESLATSPKTDQASAITNSSANGSTRDEDHLQRYSGMSASDIRSSNTFSFKSTKAKREHTAQKSKVKNTSHNSEETVDRTDGESSYSSFYSSFFKTESGSAEESDQKKILNNKGEKTSFAGPPYYEQHQPKRIAKRKMDPPWMEQVSVTSELIYKYQLLTKSMDEVLISDKQRMKNIEQPFLVNEQLAQLYLDLQLEGVAARLTLEEGITSSSSSGEENSAKPCKGRRRKREYSKLVMIYEEDAPLPPPEDATSSSTS